MSNLNPNQFASLYRGTRIEADPEQFEAADDASKARMILGALPEAGHHWSEDEDFARRWTVERAPWTEPSTVHVALTGGHPGQAAVQTDPRWLEEHGVGAYQNHEAEREVPLRSDATVPIRRVSWWERHSADPADGTWHDIDVDPVDLPVKRRTP
jgi:hypothetical protein